MNNMIPSNTGNLGSRRQFVLLFASACIGFAGMAGFFLFAENYGCVTYEGSSDFAPDNEMVRCYEQLDSYEKQQFERLTTSEETMCDEGVEVQGVIEKDDMYYSFGDCTPFGWSAPGTFTPVFVLLTGIGGAVAASRRAVRRR